MREIKFRAKRAGYGNTQWVYGHFYNNCDIGSNVNYIVQFNEAEGTGDHFPIDVGTLGQFTGLHDKNGVEIFEGDILQARYAPSYTLNTFEVKWYEGAASFVCYRKHENPQVQFEQLPLNPSNSMEDLEVIGNIHQTPELTP